ncbi:Por secretion system C-terminal sorting domain-containing protein [Aquimarina amphilecti]|uniref:Por secretion system C-terminal sorting domain-containing protein n=2 Tax=Aquimarina amphilecti TaxID=1038014 RepID=A0A1H7MXL1_AQUAM|nr:Por secretion system C-terminal sorting domain-containing protein [Aquimarina amphilecti]
MIAMILFAVSQLISQTIVERHGQLRVEGSKIKDKCNRVTQLKGMSYFWHQWEGGEYWNSNALKWLRDDWKVEVVRAAMGVRGGGGDYIDDPVGSVNQVRAVVDAAIEHGIYVVIDFHAHPNYKEEAKTFFRQMSKEYGAYPNVIYEIWNEPIGDYGNAIGTWNEIKSYSREVIAEIRANDPNNIIVVGTPFYSQRVDTAADNPLTVDINNKPVNNIAYTIHAYAGAHKQSLRDKANYAINKGLALFMTECGRVGTNYGPNNNLDAAEWNRWEQWMDNNDISYCKWSLSNKNEISSSLKTSASSNGNWNYNNDLTAEGRWNRDHFRAVNTSPSSCDDTGGNDEDLIKSIIVPDAVVKGGKAYTEVTYSSSSNRDIVAVFQLNRSPYTVYGSKRVNVSDGTDTIDIEVPIDNNTPVASNDYKFQIFITPQGKDWNERLHTISKTNIDCIQNTGNIIVRAKGTNNSRIEVRYNDTRIDDAITLTNSFVNYSFSVSETSGNFKVAFINDDTGRDVEIDWLEIDGERIQAESREENTGAWNVTCGGGSFTQAIHCNGHINFGNVNDLSQNGVIQIGAKGNCGGEKIQLLIDGKKVSEWSLENNISVYNYEGYKDNQNIKISFINDGSINNCDKNVYIDWIKVCETRYQTEDVASRTGCGNSEWLFCNGNFDFGSLNCNDKISVSGIQKTFNVFPNPVTDNKITVKGSELYTIAIYNMEGKKVYEENNISSTSTILTEHLKNGLYILKMYDRTTKTEETKKIIIDNR